MNHQSRTYKPKKCKVGGEQFVPIKPFQPTCFDHAGEWMRLQRSKKIRKKNAKAKIGLRTYSQWQDILQPEVNHIARLIDYGQLCISCGKKGKEFGGHYHSQGGNAMIRFHLHNIHLQDYQCNFPKSSNKTGYNRGLIEIYGKEYQEYVEFTLVREYKSVKPSMPEIQKAIKRAKIIVKRLKDAPQIRTPKERMKLRTELTKEIGIYPE